MGTILSIYGVDKQKNNNKILSYLASTMFFNCVTVTYRYTVYGIESYLVGGVNKGCANSLMMNVPFTAASSICNKFLLCSLLHQCVME